MPSNILKLYASNFLVGLVFWYGIEKLFMQSIGIDAVGISVTIAVLFAFNLVFDIPSGILADKWSRKGVLLVGVAALALSSLLLGLATGLELYIVGYLLYGIKIVATSGTYQALVYDSLHEKNWRTVTARSWAVPTRCF